MAGCMLRNQEMKTSQTHFATVFRILRQAALHVELHTFHAYQPQRKCTCSKTLATHTETPLLSSH
jgi:hypothetical protein